ncbi:hypothetical protein D6D02_08370 [Aureobasidium pullulans]|nr:hypothetical protein D6D23_03979 [Aureobasidium pullulans]THY02602.1 hypothetical protein D6D02_08370 [Aureobasidium pullulans]THZ95613.1 hypothetical protein D6C82_07593 [Aureobasidium pullulans]
MGPTSVEPGSLRESLLFLLSSAAVVATAKPIGSVSTDSVGGPAPSPHQLEASATWPRFYTYHDRHDTQYDSAATIVDDKTLESRNDVAEPGQVLPLELGTHSQPVDFCFDDYCCSGSQCGMVPANEHAEFLEARGDDAMYDRDYSLEPRAAGGPRDHFCWSPQDPMCQPDPPAAQIKAREARDTDVKSGTVDWLESGAAAHPPRRYCWSDVDPFCSGPPAAQIKAREAHENSIQPGTIEWLEPRAAARPPERTCWSDLDPLCSGPPLEGRRVNSQHGSKRLSQAKARESVIISAPVNDSIVAGKTPLLARASRPPGRFCFGHYGWFCRQTAHGEAK